MCLTPKIPAPPPPVAPPQAPKAPELSSIRRRNPLAPLPAGGLPADGLLTGAAGVAPASVNRATTTALGG